MSLDCLRTNLPTKRNLSRSRQRLLELIERYSFARIENIEVRGGEPVFNPAPRVIQEVKFGVEEEPHPDAANDNLPLRAPIVTLFEHLERLGNGRVAELQIRHHLPFKLLLERPSGGDA
jgi:hypothetical protein